MAIKPPLAIGLGATTFGVAAGGIYYAVNYSNTNSIEQEIKKSNRTILSQSATTWDIKLSTYNSEFKSKVSLSSEDITGLKKWCETTLKSNFKDKQDSNFLNAKKLCTTPTNKEKLIHSKKKLAGDNDWKVKETEYKNAITNKTPIDEIAVESATGADIKKWCEKTWEKEITEGTNNPYTLADKWCTVVSGPAG